MDVEVRLRTRLNDELAVAKHPGGRWHAILTALVDGGKTTSEIFKLTRNRDLPGRVEKFRLWTCLDLLRSEEHTSELQSH